MSSGTAHMSAQGEPMSIHPAMMYYYPPFLSRPSTSTASESLRPHPPPAMLEEEEEAEAEMDEYSEKSPDSPNKRRPGRPKGSKNKKQKHGASFVANPQPPIVPQTPTPAASTSAATTPVSAPVPPPPNTTQEQEFYDFHWRLLKLCSEFYSAASELINRASPWVLVKVFEEKDGKRPVDVLYQAQYACEFLMRNSLSVSQAKQQQSQTPQLHPHPPPPYPPSAIPQSAAASPAPVPPPPTPAAPPPGSFGQMRAAPQQPNPMLFPTYTISSPSQKSSLLDTTPQPPLSSDPTQGGSLGPWSKEETETLRKLAEAHRLPSGEVDWDKVVELFGSGRSRHQILVKATQMQLKPAFVRGRANAVKEGANGVPPSPSTTSADARSPPQPQSVQLQHPQQQQQAPSQQSQQQQQLNLSRPSTAGTMSVAQSQQTQTINPQQLSKRPSVQQQLHQSPHLHQHQPLHPYPSQTQSPQSQQSQLSQSQMQQSQSQTQTSHQTPMQPQHSQLQFDPHAHHRVFSQLTNSPHHSQQQLHHLSQQHSPPSHHSSLSAVSSPTTGPGHMPWNMPMGASSYYREHVSGPVKNGVVLTPSQPTYMQPGDIYGLQQPNGYIPADYQRRSHMNPGPR